MGKVIGACGYSYTGSGAIMDLLHEFDDAQVLDDLEFSIAYYPDGLSDLDWQLNHNCCRHFGTLAIQRFRRLTKSRTYMRQIEKKRMNELTDQFLEKIVQVRWRGLSAEERGRFSYFFKRGLGIFAYKFATITKIKKMPKLYFMLTCHKQELSACPKNFDTAAKEYVGALLDEMGRDKSKSTALNQPFAGNNPEKSYKYFENPKAIVVDRDPRDLYICTKVFYRNLGDGVMIASDTVDDFIAWYKAVRMKPYGLSQEALYLNFEELIYDYDNAVKKISDFCGVSEHNRKFERFKPSRSRINTQMFKKYSGFESDITRIEQDLSEYIFQFGNYPDVEPDGEMFL